MNASLGKRILSVCLLTTLLTALLPTNARAAAYTAQAPQAYAFHTAIESGGTDSVRTMLYTEDYFSHPASDYNPSLASASLCLAMSAFGSNRIFKSNGGYDFTQANYNWLELFRDTLGFSDVKTNDYFTRATTTDNIGVGMAWKTITVDDGSGNAKSVPLVAVGVRGSNYMSEWGGNVNVGTSGDHAGFKKAAEIVTEEVKKYIQSIPSLSGKDVKLWISGFSRAAATSNLFSGYLDEAIAAGSAESRIGARLTKDDLYCYTFETPAGTIRPYNVAHGDTYSNIFNIINPNDLVPKVAPYFTDASFIRYGTDLNLPSSITTVNYESYENLMKTIFAQVTGGTAYIIDKFEGYRIEINGVWPDDVNKPQSSAEFCSRFVADLAANAVRTRSHFIQAYQKPLAELMDFFCGSGERFGGKANQKRFLSYFNSGWNIFKMFLTLLGKLIGEKQWPRDNVKNTFISVLKSARKNSGVSLPDAYISDVSEMATAILWELVGDHPLDNLKEINYFLSFKNGALNILQAHDPDICLSWLMSMDRNYFDAGITKSLQSHNDVLNCGEYRAVTLTGVTTTEVERLDPVTGKVISRKRYSADALGSRQLRILLPVDATYRMTIWSTPVIGSYNFNYMVSEYSPALNGEKRVFYYKNPVDTTTSFTEYTAMLPAYSTGMGSIPDPIKFGIPEGSDLDYRLFYKGKLLSRVSINRLLSDIRGKSGNGLSELEITSQPLNQLNVYKDSAVFSVTAKGESLNYQWFVGDANGENWREIPGATQSTYAIENVSDSMVGNLYICRVYDLCCDYQYTNAVELYRLPVTGDSATPLLWVLLLLLSMGGCLCVIVRYRKRRAL